MSTYIRKQHLLDSDLKRGPGKENTMIKCAAFLIEQILTHKRTHKKKKIVNGSHKSD